MDDFVLDWNNSILSKNATAKLGFAIDTGTHGRSDVRFVEVAPLISQEAQPDPTMAATYAHDGGHLCRNLCTHPGLSRHHLGRPDISKRYFIFHFNHVSCTFKLGYSGIILFNVFSCTISNFYCFNVFPPFHQRIILQHFVYPSAQLDRIIIRHHRPRFLVVPGATVLGNGQFH